MGLRLFYDILYRNFYTEICEYFFLIVKYKKKVLSVPSH